MKGTTNKLILVMAAMCCIGFNANTFAADANPGNGIECRCYATMSPEAACEATRKTKCQVSGVGATKDQAMKMGVGACKIALLQYTGKDGECKDGDFSLCHQANTPGTLPCDK